jgi:hypothetical protein
MEKIKFEKRVINIFALWLLVAFLLCHYSPHAHIFYLVSMGYLLFAEVKENRRDRAEEESMATWKTDTMTLLVGAPPSHLSTWYST